MSTPLEAQPKKESRIEDPPEDAEENHAANEAVEGLERLTRSAAAKRDEIANLPSQEVLLGQLADPNAIAKTETFKRDAGYTVNAGRDASGNVVRITETDGTEWNRSPDGKSFVLKQTGERVPVKDIKFDQDGSYTLVLPDGRQMKRNADRSVSMLDAKGNETKRMNNDGTQLLFDDKHRVTASIDASGAKRGYGYDKDGRLASVVESDGSVWRSSDGKNWHNEKTRQNRSGEISVAQDGAQTVKNSRGETTTFKMDGSTVSRDKDGNVTAVRNKDGEERRFTYDANKKLSGVQEPDGSVWRTKDGKNWQQDGTKNAAKLEIAVDSDGTVREKYSNAKEVAKRTDGWNEVKEGNRSRFERTNADGSQVTKNELDQVTQIIDAKGRPRKFEYDEQGRINKMTDSTGTWTTKDGQNWTNDKTKDTWKGKLEAGPEGLYREVAADGSKKVFKPDGSNISVNNENKITRVEASNGTWRQFDYGKDGKILKVTESTGAKWSTADGTNWTREGSNETRKMNVSVRPDGTYQESDLTTGNRRVGTTDGRNLTFDKNSVIQRAENVDGSSTRFDYGDRGQVKGFHVKNKDGSQITLDQQGRVTRTQSADNQVREFKYGSNGKLSEIKEADGKIWTSKDGENWESNKGDKSKGAAWVTPDGNYNYVENNSVVTKRLDGNAQYRDSSGASRTENKSGQVVETVDSKGVKRTYAYGADGNVNKMTEGDATWETKDGRNWTNTKDGAKWQGTVKVEKDGSYFHEDAAGNRQWRKMDGSRQDVNYQAMDAAAEALETAMNRGFMWGAGTDKDTIYATLENKTEAERKMIKEIWDRKYKEKYGWDLEKEFEDEMTGSDLEKAKSLLTRPDGADNAGTIRQALVERGETFGRSNSELEKIVRNSLETMSSAEIAKTDAEYRRRYGVSLNDAIQNDPNLSKETKAAAAVYIKGHDQRTAADTQKLAVDAAHAGNAEMFQEAMRRAPKEVRDYFAGPEGQKLIKDNFEGHWYHAFTFGLSGNVTDTELNHVKDYAEYGKLSVATQVSDNRSWLGDNEEAIEQSLANMSKEERDRYALGKRISNNETLENPVSEAERQKALDYYTKTHEQLKAAAGKWFSGDSQVNELAKWEDMITQKGGSLVTQLANHRGNIYDSSMQDVISTVENMSREDWDRLKNDPAQIGKIEQVLKTYLSQEEFDRTMKVVNDKKNATSYEASQQQRRPVLDAIEDNKRWYNNDEAAIYRTIENMTDDERASYKRGGEPGADPKDKKFKDDLDERLRGALDASEQKVAFGLLDQVKRGEKPAMGIMDKLNLQASYFDADEAQVIRDIQSAFDKDPKMRDRINNPQTPEDKAFSEQFKDAARRAMGSSDYEKYAKPLIETGKLSVELQMDLNRGVFDDDEQGAYQDIQRASAAEKQRILTDKRFQDRVMGFLSDDERKVALASMEQGEMRPEDKLRSYQLGLGTSEAEIKETLAGLNDRTQLKAEGKSEAEIDQIIQQRLQKVRDEYARKYGSDLSADLISELGGKDQRQALRQVNGRDARAEFLFAMQEAATTRSGFGSRFVDNAWDGTGYQLDNEVNQLAAKMVEDPARMREYVDNVYKMVDMHASSKEALADAVVDTAIAAGAVGGAFFTGGVSLSLLAYTGAAAAVFKVGAKGAIMGGDYDWGSSQVVLDGATGFADGFTTFLGAGVATSAADKVLVLGGRQLIKEGGEAALKRGAATLVKEGLAQGGKITDEAIGILAKQISKEGQEQAVAQLLKKSIAESMEEQSRTMLKQLIKSTPDNVLAGMAGGGLSGTIRAGAEARDFNEFMRMAGTSTAFGALGGSVGTWVLAPSLSVAGKGLSSMRALVSREAGSIDNVANLANRAANGASETNLPGRRVAQQSAEEGAIVRARTDEPVVEQPVIPSREAGDHVRVANEPPARVENDPAVRVDGDSPAVRREGGVEQPVRNGDGTNGGDQPPARRTEDLEPGNARLRDATGDAPATRFDPARIRDFAKELEAKFTDRPITPEQFRQVFDGMSDADKRLALELLEQSAPNMHPRKVDAQMAALAKRLQSMPNIKEEGVKVFTLSGDTSGNALGYLLKNNAGHAKIEIVELTPTAMKAMVDSGQFPKNGVIFDNLATATPAQRELLSKVDNLIVADMGGFDKGLNMYDFGAAKYAGPELIQGKLKELIAEARRMPGSEGLTDEQLARKVLAGNAREQAAAINPKAEVIDSPTIPNRKAARSEASVGQPDALRQKHQIDSLYSEFTTPLITQEQILDFLGKMSGDRQAISAHILRDGMHYQSYSTMMGQMRDLHAQALAQLPPGKGPKDIIIVTGVEKNGSEYLINHLYAKVNGLGPENFMTLSELAAKGPGAADGKVVMYVDDYAYSGRQGAGVIHNNADVLKESGGKVLVGTLGRYQTDFDPMKLHLTDTRFSGLGLVNPTAISPNTYPGFYEYIQQANNPLGRYFTLEQIQKVAGGKTAYKGSVVQANLLMPYGGPNNNLKFLAEFIKKVGL
ncbi:MAG TPA: hypothetical protein PKZ32_01250 [Candidatus Melainabacteria bacterium]|nr:hypothetical protein [Candidatus Melainabacteria bacterium]